LKERLKLNVKIRYCVEGERKHIAGELVEENTTSLRVKGNKDGKEFEISKALPYEMRRDD